MRSTADIPIAMLLTVGGTLSCFAGYRLFRAVLAIYGFVVGSSFVGTVVHVQNAVGALLVWLGGGIAGALLFVFAYFVAVGLIGAALGALVTHVIWSAVGTNDPPWVLMLILAVLGAVGAILLQRYVIIVSTAFGGSWMILIASLAASGDRRAQAAINSHNWVLSPFATATIAAWIPVAWIALGLLGTTVQLGVTARRKTT
jgi:hypothetical protein